MAQNVFEERWHKMCTTEYKWKWARRGRIRHEYQLLRGKLPQQDKQEPEHCWSLVPWAVGGSSQITVADEEAGAQNVSQATACVTLHPLFRSAPLYLYLI